MPQIAYAHSVREFIRELLKRFIPGKWIDRAISDRNHWGQAPPNPCETGLSFREYLAFEGIKGVSPLGLDEILVNHREIARKIARDVKREAMKREPSADIYR